MLEEILHEQVPDAEVWAYGSRVSGQSHGGSDLDLVLRGPGLEEIAIGKLVALEEALRLSTIPFLVEARDWARLPGSFCREIGRDYFILISEEEKMARADRSPAARRGDRGGSDDRGLEEICARKDGHAAA